MADINFTIGSTFSGEGFKELQQKTQLVSGYLKQAASMSSQLAGAMSGMDNAVGKATAAVAGLMSALATGNPYLIAIQAGVQALNYIMNQYKKEAEEAKKATDEFFDSINKKWTGDFSKLISQMDLLTQRMEKTSQLSLRLSSLSTKGELHDLKLKEVLKDIELEREISKLPSDKREKRRAVAELERAFDKEINGSADTIQSKNNYNAAQKRLDDLKAIKQKKEDDVGKIAESIESRKSQVKDIQQLIDTQEKIDTRGWFSKSIDWIKSDLQKTWSFLKDDLSDDKLKRDIENSKGNDVFSSPVVNYVKDDLKATCSFDDYYEKMFNFVYGHHPKDLDYEVAELINDGRNKIVDDRNKIFKSNDKVAYNEAKKDLLPTLNIPKIDTPKVDNIEDILLRKHDETPVKSTPDKNTDKKVSFDISSAKKLMLKLKDEIEEQNKELENRKKSIADIDSEIKAAEKEVENAKKEVNISENTDILNRTKAENKLEDINKQEKQKEEQARKEAEEYKKELEDKKREDDIDKEIIDSEKLLKEAIEDLNFTTEECQQAYEEFLEGLKTLYGNPTSGINPNSPNNDGGSSTNNDNPPEMSTRRFNDITFDEGLRNQYIKSLLAGKDDKKFTKQDWLQQAVDAFVKKNGYVSQYQENNIRKLAARQYDNYMHSAEANDLRKEAKSGRLENAYKDGKMSKELADAVDGKSGDKLKKMEEEYAKQKEKTEKAKDKVDNAKDEKARIRALKDYDRQEKRQNELAKKLGIEQDSNGELKTPDLNIQLLTEIKTILDAIKSNTSVFEDLGLK